MEDPVSDSFFFTQTTFRKTPKRFKKSPEELPTELRFSHLNPRVAAYLANKEKEEREIPSEVFGDGLGNRSLLPQIGQKVTTIRHHLDSALTQDEDSQRFLFQECKTSAVPILVQLARILFYVERRGRVQLPATLSAEIQRSHVELISDVVVLSREWQLVSKREAYYDAKAKAAEELVTAEKKKAEAAEELRMKQELADQDDISKAGTPKDADGKASRSGTKSSHVRPTALTDILEDEEGQAKRKSPRPTSMGVPAHTPRKESRKSISKSRLQSRQDSRHTLQIGSRKANRLDDVASIATLSDSRSVMGNAGYMQVIFSFQLSNKSCDEKGWVVHPESTEEREREACIEGSIQRMQMVLQQRKQDESADKSRGVTKVTPVYRFYGDGRRDATQAKYSRGDNSNSSVLDKNDLPRIPEMHPIDPPNKKLFMSTVADGSTILFYLSRRPAVVYSATIPGKPGFYTLIYDDTSDNTLLGCFTPTGRGACYHSNGIVKFLSTGEGGTLASETGEILRRWGWPHGGAKLANTIVFNLNRWLTFKCLNINQMSVTFTCDKETFKFSVGSTVGAHDPHSKEEMGLLQSGLPFTSQAAKDCVKQTKPKPKPKNKLNTKMNKRSRSPSSNPELQKLIDFPEPTENDETADKHLYRLQRKAKNIVDDWLEHYRLSCGMKSPHLKGVHEQPSHKHIRLVKSAKPPAQGARAIIESMATAVPKVTISPRIPSAPAGRKKEDLDFSDDPVISSSARPASATLTTTVKFDDQTYIEESENEMPIFYQPQQRAQSSVVHGSVGILKNKGLKLPVLVPNSLVCASDPDFTTSSGPMARADVKLRSGSASNLTRSAPIHLINRTDQMALGPCPVSLQQLYLGDTRAICHCSRHKIPFITDLVYDEFIQKQVSSKQMLIVGVFSSLHPERAVGLQMLESIYFGRNKNRTRPCLQSKSDPYRVVLYDVNSAADYTDFSSPLLLRRHNVLPGMFLIYQGGKLLFCDHIFNGYGNARKDFQKQLMQTKISAQQGHSLPKDFRFSPQRGRSGQRSAWGGEIGGAGVDHHGGIGLNGAPNSLLAPKDSMLSLSSTDTVDNILLDYPSGVSDIKLPYMATSARGPHGPDTYIQYAQGGPAQHWPEMFQTTT